MFCRKGVLKNFAKFTGKHLCQSPFLNKVSRGSCNFIKKEALAQVFHVNFVKFLRIPFLQDTFERLLLTDFHWKIQIIFIIAKHVWPSYRISKKECLYNSVNSETVHFASVSLWFQILPLLLWNFERTFLKEDFTSI